MQERENWKNRQTFIMAAVGSAIGLGNLWRFPFITAQNGGGAFLVPYFIAILTAGIPVMIIEYGLGIRSRKSANVALGAIRPSFRFFGWFAIIGAFIMNVYYCAIMGWSWCYIFDSFSLQEWASTVITSKAHFENQVLGVSAVGGNPFNFGGFQWHILAGLIATWVVIWFIIKGGVDRVGKVLMYTVLLPVALIIILVIRGLTLPGALTGLNYYLSPEWGKLADPQVWLAAYGQVFFSLSVGFGTMIAYSSFMPRNSEIPNSAAITSFADCSFSFLAGFAVFSVLGYFAVITNTPVSEMGGGPGLAFAVYPAALAQLPFWCRLFALLFFCCLLFLGIDSAFSLLETVTAAVIDKFSISRNKAVTAVTVISVVLGLPFATKAGLLWLDIVDHFLANYIICFIGLVECIIIGYVFGLKKFTAEINKHAEIKLGPMFSIMVLFVAPVVLIISFGLSLIKEFQKPYEGYPVASLVIIGGGTLLFAVIASFILGSLRNKNDPEMNAINELRAKDNPKVEG